MKANELREMADEELSQQMTDHREELLRLRFQAAIGVAENPLRMRALRRDIARILTIQRERSTGGTEKTESD